MAVNFACYHNGRRESLRDHNGRGAEEVESHSDHANVNVDPFLVSRQ